MFKFLGYGAIGNNNFRFFNKKIAEGITATGQLAIKYIEKQINEFLNAELGTEGLDFVVAVDTDSVVGSTIIETEKSKQTIESFYDENAGEVIKQSEDNFTVKPNKPVKVLTYKNNELVYRNVNYIKKHKVKKRMFKLKVNGNEVIITEDHSLVVERNGILTEVKPKDVLHTDTFVSLK